MKHSVLGFTLIELLVVISIIGLLAAAGLASYKGITKRTQYATAKSDMRELVKLIDLARGDSGMTFAQIMIQAGVISPYCVECPYCRSNPLSAQCLLDHQKGIAELNTAANGALILPEDMLDPWGHPYTFNPNEGEGGCFTDNIDSYGPDGAWNTADDIILNFPTYSCGTGTPHHPNQNWN